MYVFAENNSQDRTLKIAWGFQRPKKIIRLWFRRDAGKIVDPERIIKPPFEGRGDPWAIVAIMRQFLLQCARKIDPDYTILIDSDVFVTNPDLIERLTYWQKDIVAALVLKKGGTKGLIKKNGRMQTVLLERKIVPNCWEDDLHKVRRNFRGLQEPLMVDLECTCLSRKVIQDRRINFHPIKDAQAEDAAYMRQTRILGYDHFLDSTLELQHYDWPGFDYNPWTQISGKGGIDFEFKG